MVNRLCRCIAVVCLVPALAAFVLSVPNRKQFGKLVIRIDDRGISSITDFDHGVTAAINAANKWNDAIGRQVVVVQVGPTVYQFGDGQSVAYFDDPNHMAAFPITATTLSGYTADQTIWCNGVKYARITEADISFDIAGYNWTSAQAQTTCSAEVYLEGIIQHEIGHALGLGHSADPNAVMYGSPTLCRDTRIGPDDTAGIRFIYDCAPVRGHGRHRNDDMATEVP